MSVRRVTIEDFVVIAYLLKKVAEAGKGLTPARQAQFSACHRFCLHTSHGIPGVRRIRVEPRPGVSGPVTHTWPPPPGVDSHAT